MAEATVNRTLEMFGKLSPEDQEMVLEIARKRRAEAWRKELAEDIAQARRDLAAGKLKIEPHETMLRRLRRGLKPRER